MLDKGGKQIVSLKSNHKTGRKHYIIISISIGKALDKINAIYDKNISTN